MNLYQVNGTYVLAQSSHKALMIFMDNHADNLPSAIVCKPVRPRNVALH